LEKLKTFCRQEAVFVAAALAAASSMLLTPPSPAYLKYVDGTVLIQLFCLMAVVAGLEQAGVLDAFARQLLRRAGTSGRLTAALALLCFFAAMLLTNDVVLLTFVPLTLLLIPPERERHRIWTVVLETAAANLGSLATPVGNPQNLFLYNHYGLSAPSFFRIVLPLAAAALAAVCALCLLTPERRTPAETCVDARPLKRGSAIKYAGLFLLCVLTVFHAAPVWLCLGAVVLVLLLTDRGLLGRVDWLLLATFVCFFIFVGNLSALPAVSGLLSQALAGRELPAGALVSQVISNVPAAVLLAPFTNNVRDLLLGVNIGGLGTPVASLASLISYRLYCAAPLPHRRRYLMVFSAVNFGLLGLFLLLFGALF
jgi:Na+/H+ antiporter NhaD/arsenite permease-like protein